MHQRITLNPLYCERSAYFLDNTLETKEHLELSRSKLRGIEILRIENK